MSRPATLADFLGYDPRTIPNNDPVDSIARSNVEYGAKKFIKPWRTGTKSQQLPPRGGRKSKGETHDDYNRNSRGYTPTIIALETRNYYNL